MISVPDERIEAVERPKVPRVSVLVGYGPMVPIVIGALAVWVTGGVIHRNALHLVVVYAASILAFLGGVRRGLSFRAEGSPALMQLATMFSLWLLALIALVAIAMSVPVIATAALSLGYLMILVLDPIAAHAGQAPLFFARLRSTQTLIALAALLALLANAALYGNTGLHWLRPSATPSGARNTNAVIQQR